MATVHTKYFEYGNEEMNYLASVDGVLGAAIRRMGKVERVVIPDLFTALVYSIVGQLISAKAVQTIWTRMQDQLGEISPQNLADQTADDIQSCGMTMRKAVCIHHIADTIAQGDFSIDDWIELSDQEVIKKLIALKGVGQWTAEMLLIHALERPDVLSWGDIAIRRGLMKLHGLESLSKEQFETYRRLYSPYGSVASIYLWVLSFD